MHRVLKVVLRRKGTKASVGVGAAAGGDPGRGRAREALKETGSRPQVDSYRNRPMNLNRKLREIVARDSRYPLAAYEFLFCALDFTMEELDRRNLADEESRHISGPELLRGIQRYAIQQYGYLTRFVFNRWGIRTTDDFGELVFNLVENNLLKKRPEDCREDFHDVYEFTEAFDVPALQEVVWPQEGEGGD